MQCRLWSKIYGLDTVSLRYFNVYSEDQQAKTAYATAIANWMHHIREDRAPFLNGDGKNRRDMLHVSDAVSANVFAMEYDGIFSGTTYDVGTGVNISLNEIIEIIHEHFPDVTFEQRPPRKGDILLTKAKTSDLKKLGWQAKIQINDGINSCFSSLKEFKLGRGRSRLRNNSYGVM